MTKSKALVWILVFLTLLAIWTFCETKVAKAQTSTTYSPLVIGENDEVKVVTIWSRINASGDRRNFSYKFLNDKGQLVDINVVFSNGGGGPRAWGVASEMPKSISTATLSSVNASSIMFGYIMLDGPDIISQVVFQLRDKKTGQIVGSYGVGASPAIGDNFLVQAIIKSATETGFMVMSPEPATLGLELFDDSGRLVTSTTVYTKADSPQVFFMSQLFPGLPKDYLGNPLTEGTLEIKSNSKIFIAGFRKDGEVYCGIPVFPGRD